MIGDCKKGKIDRIIVKSVSRFARNTQALLTAIRMLKEIGANVRWGKDQSAKEGKVPFAEH